MTLFRVGSIQVGDRRELCLIKNISAGGMMIRLYCTLDVGTSLTVELKSGQPVNGTISWVRDQNAGVAFDQPIDVIDILSTSMDGPRPRMPRIETGCHATLRDGSTVLRVEARDISQGGVKLRCDTLIPDGTDVVVSLPGLPAQAGVARWSDQGFMGVTFNRLLSLGELVAWLHAQRAAQCSAG
ncbi:PilZ domain-containing protein [Sphingomonas xanthus]|uniref:PilZ domain-containing protein n=2 Tax=Sphingomonas xanthus TaxID=2594473 RepID=A0A516ITD1_9SPHN|nr:PilZ domain-containing protein [Sphingomonas xanthus]